jgi:hypothetical protein
LAAEAAAFFAPVGWIEMLWLPAPRPLVAHTT